MFRRFKRPPAVWLTQGILLFFAASYLFVGVSLIPTIIKRTDSAVLSVRMLLLFLGLELCLLVPFWGLVKKRPYGRWLGLLSLAVIWGYVTYYQLSPRNVSSIYSNDASGDFAAVVTGQVLANVGLIILMLRLAFANRVTQFFRRELDVA